MRETGSENTPETARAEKYAPSQGRGAQPGKPGPCILLAGSTGALGAATGADDHFLQQLLPSPVCFSLPGKGKATFFQLSMGRGLKLLPVRNLSLFGFSELKDLVRSCQRAVQRLEIRKAGFESWGRGGWVKLS